MKTKKRFAPVVDWARQGEQKNISYLDYPMINYYTDRKLRHNFSYYYSDWKKYCREIEPGEYDYLL